MDEGQCKMLTTISTSTQQGFAFPLLTLSFSWQSKQDARVNNVNISFKVSDDRMTPNKISIVSRWRGRFLHFDKKLFCILPQCDKLGCQPWAKRETSLSAEDRIKSPGTDKSVKKHLRVPLQINLQDKKLLNEKDLKIVSIQLGILQCFFRWLKLHRITKVSRTAADLLFCN